MNKFFTLAVAAVVSLSFVGSASAALSLGAENDGMPSLKYDEATGNLTIQTDGQGPFGLFELGSASNQLISGNLNVPAGAAATQREDTVGFVLFVGNFVEAGADYDLGAILPAGLSIQEVAEDISRAFVTPSGQPAVNLDLVGVAIPEPTTFALAGLALVGFAGLRRRS